MKKITSLLIMTGILACSLSTSALADHYYVCSHEICNYEGPDKPSVFECNDGDDGDSLILDFDKLNKECTLINNDE